MKKIWEKVTRILLAMCLMTSLFISVPVYAENNHDAENITFDLRIVHTNDIHARVEEDDYNKVIGMDRLCGIIHSFTQGADGSLVLDSGDTFHGQSIATLVRGESVARLMKICGYDAMTAGNHDWSYGKDRLKELGEIAGVSILAGNVVNEDKTPFFNQDTYIKEITKNGKTLKIGVFGVCDPQMQKKTTPSNVSGLVFEDSVTYAKQMAAELRKQGCNIVIALSHTLAPQELAEKVNGVDLWLCGHEHMELNEKVTTPDGKITYVSESGHYLDTVGLINLECTIDENGETNFSYERTSVDYEQSLLYEKDDSATALLNEIKAENETELNREIGTSPVELDGVWEHLRIGQTNLGNVITDAYLFATNADVALENAGGIRASIKEGTITYGDVINVSPYGNYIVTKQVSGAQLKEMIETSLQIQKNCIVANDSGEWDAWPNDSGSYLQIGGIVVNYDLDQPEGERVLSIKKNGEELETEKLYTVAVNNYLAESSSYPQLANAEEIGEFSSCDEALIRFFEQGSDKIAESAAKKCMIQTKKEEKNPGETEKPSEPEKKETPESESTKIPEKEEKKSETPSVIKSNNKKENVAATNNSNKKISVDKRAEKVEAAKTADDNNVMPWLILLLLSSSVGFERYKKFKKNKLE